MKTLTTRFLTACTLFLIPLAAIAQPLHQPIPNYTNDPYNRTGHGSEMVTGSAGFMENTIGGIAVNGNVHYLTQKVSENGNYDEILLEQKNATNGTLIANTRINIGVHGGLSPSQDFVRGLLLDPALNRAYLCGSTGSDGFILCFDMSTLAVVSGFGNNGLYIFGNAPAVGMVLTGVGNNFLIALNQSNTIQLYEYTSTLVSVLSGTITLSNFNCFASRFTLKKAPNGHFFIAGNATDISTSTPRPMIWDLTRIASSGYIVTNSTAPVPMSVGSGSYYDYDFYVNPNPPNPNGYLFDVVAVGNTAGNNGTGIYARYIITTAPNYYTPDVSYNNQSSLPGLATPVNSSVAPIRFTRCTADASGYVTVLGYYTTGLEQGVLGYLTPSGTQYYTTYTEPLPSANQLARLHKMTGLSKDGNGNILISGCTMGYSHTITKLSDNYDCRPVYNLKGSTTLICRGNAATLNFNPTTPNCTITWRSVSPVVSTIYSGLPVALQVYPQVTTTYEITVTNTATGCTSISTITVQVLNDPTFNLTINTANSSYFTLSALANDQLGSAPGFGYAWFIERLDPLNNNSVIFDIPNNSCWWIPLTTPTTFSGVDCINNNYLGTVTLSSCSPAVGKFRYGHRYRITRGTWTDDCGWQQQSIIIQPSYYQDPDGLIVHNGEETIAPDFSDRVLRADKATGVNLYPNPNHGSFYLSTDAVFTGDFLIYDPAGKLIATIARTDDQRQQIDPGQLSRGIYYLRAEVNGVAGVYRFVVE